MDPALFQDVLLSAAQERSLDGTLAKLVGGLTADGDVALARIWLIKPADICDSCLLQPECPSRDKCLHLVASSGASVQGERWDGITGNFRRFPLGVRKVGVTATQGPVLMEELELGQVVRAEWAKEEGVCSFAGQPLVFDGETTGVLALFSRKPITNDHFRWLRMFADQAAAAIANADAFDQIRSLQSRLEQENEYLREEVKEAHEFGDIISTGPALRKVLQQVELVAPTVANVLIHGESGTGKELIARAIHERSNRSDQPMIKVNCATIPKELFESEFFGHVRGSFTGAVKDRVGRFELADGGTLFLDEVGEIPIELQSKLLRVLQEGEFERVGDAKSKKVDVRIISATNRDLTEESAKGNFRPDLFYRLSVFPIDIPPLRDRTEDIGPLAHHFISVAAQRHGVPPVRLTKAHIAELSRHDWPGNVRELHHVLERAVILSTGGKFDPAAALPAKRAGQPGGEPHTEEVSRGLISFERLKELERSSIQEALSKTGGKVYGTGGAAELLGTKPTTLASRIKALGIAKSDEG